MNELINPSKIYFKKHESGRVVALSTLWWMMQTAYKEEEGLNKDLIILLDHCKY